MQLIAAKLNRAAYPTGSTTIPSFAYTPIVSYVVESYGPGGTKWRCGAATLGTAKTPTTSIEDVISWADEAVWARFSSMN
jgi:hypothetical protein